MLATRSLCQQALRLTLFTRQNCGLCRDAKVVLSGVRKKRDFGYEEIDVMTAGQQKWKDTYEFDTPVVHIDKSNAGGKIGETTTKAKKLMHRFKEVELMSAMDEVGN
ncbi:hypothetical protein LTR78_007504 [Recurvomyces mirabilis]|uniref:Glutaredoxin-like protein n=1 Tax=Recurvomyces mirabilis TaxID=574656 RepID=A0AAE0TSQ3_9PEZI|nr:hypothetical protein LTR78_007504 [Recurvomyces mirabilis]KAK5159986.1 hypothetical protein LTS14_002092 [Recurvomyces mirabilis]